MKLNVQRVGSGVPLVLLPGWGFDSRVWQGVLEGLSSSFEVTLLDLPGSGFNQQVSITADFQQYVAEISSVIPEQSVIVGWSLGGLLAMQLAQLFPDKVAKLVTLAATPCFLEKESWNGVSPQVFDDFYQTVKDHRDKAARQFCRWLAPSITQRTLYQTLLELFCEKAASLTTLNFLKDQDVRANHATWGGKSLHLLGDQDALVPQQHKAKEFNISREIIEGAGHALLITHPEQVSQKIVEFLNAR
jgi:pimeloyl-[acyl-carrier protein] methyl ester esterase